MFIWERLVPKIDPYLCPLPAFFPVEKLQSKNKLNQKNQKMENENQARQNSNALAIKQNQGPF